VYEKLTKTKCTNFTWFLPEKLAKCPNFIIFFRKIIKIPKFYTIFARKMPEFYIIIARKIFFPNFRGHVSPPAPPSSTSMPSTKIWMKIDPYYQRQKCRTGVIVSSKISFMHIFAGVRWRGGIKWEWGGRKWRFSLLSLMVSLLSVCQASVRVCLSADSLAPGFKTKKASVMISSPSVNLNILLSRNIWFITKFERGSPRARAISETGVGYELATFRNKPPYLRNGAR